MRTRVKVLPSSPVPAAIYRSGDLNLFVWDAESLRKLLVGEGWESRLEDFANALFESAEGEGGGGTVYPLPKARAKLALVAAVAAVALWLPSLASLSERF